MGKRVVYFLCVFFYVRGVEAGTKPNFVRQEI